MELKYQNNHRSKHHCTTVLLRCMDFRFHGYIDQHLAEVIGEEGLAYDSPGLGAGGSKVLIDEDSREMALKYIGLALKLHGVSRLVIIDHIDCGAWGGSKAFSSQSDEEEFHRAKLEDAKAIVQKAFPSLEVILVYQDWESIKNLR